MAVTQIQRRLIFDNGVIPVRYAWVDSWVIDDVVKFLQSRHPAVTWDVYVERKDEMVGLYVPDFEETSKLKQLIVDKFQFKLLA